MKYLVAVILGVIAADLPPLPPLLDRALSTMPGVRVLDPSADLPAGGYTSDELNALGYWPPWAMTDLDRDGRPDIVAVVVKPGTMREFGVIAVHARTPAAGWIPASFIGARDGCDPLP